MQAFLDNARVQATQEGLYFYERDILMSSYLFNRDLQIDLKMSYVRSGFGIVIAEGSPIEPRHSYLYHLGSNSFTVYERHLLQQQEYSTRANVLSPGSNIILRFILKDNKGKFILISTDVDGTKRETVLGEHVISRFLSSYYVGIYSQAGNTVYDISFLQGIPDRWHCSIANVHGGRISFWDDSFMFENCIHDAELEQKELILPAGTFWLDYDTEEVNGKYDIEGFIYPSKIPDPPADINSVDYESKRANFDEQWLEDIGKTLVHNQGSFTLTEETSVILSFKGTSGKVNNICIKDSKNGEYISTDKEAIRTDGSWMSIDLTGVTALKWEGIVFDLPPYEDFSKPCPFSIMKSVNNKSSISPAALFIDLNKQYNYYYDVATAKLSVIETETEMFVGDDTLEKDSEVKIFVNLKGQITNFTLVMEDGSEVNINNKTTYKVFVPGYVKGPIIVTDKNSNSFDLSGSYREVIDDNNYVIDLFYKSSLELKLSYHTSTLWQEIEVFGIPIGADISTSETEIDKFATAYTKISSDLFSVVNDVIQMPEEVRNDYLYIAVRYQRCDKFMYYMTVYERELFKGNMDTLKLSSDINNSKQGIIVFGIRQGTLDKDYLLRVPDKDMINSIDLCASRYDMISPFFYTVKKEDNSVYLNSALDDEYDYYIVDYLKENSYAVNWNNILQQYEVDIATDEDIIMIHYEMDNNGLSERTINTDIKSDSNKFIILKRNKGAFSDED